MIEVKVFEKLTHPRLTVFGVAAVMLFFGISATNCSIAQTPRSNSSITDFANSDPEASRQVEVEYESQQTIILKVGDDIKMT